MSPGELLRDKGFSRAAQVLLYAAAGLELLELLGVIPPFVTIAFVRLSWAVPLCLAVLGIRLYRYTRSPVSSVVILRSMGILVCLLTVAAVIYIASAGPGVALAVAIAVTSEELIYRLVLPAVLAAMFVRAGVGPAPSLGIALAISAVLFLLMPGHLAQVTSPATALAFLCFSALMSYAVWRGRLIFAAIAAHMAIDYLTFSAKAGTVPGGMRAGGVVAVLITLVLVVRSSAPAPLESEQSREVALLKP